MIARNIVLFCFLVGNLTIAPRPDALAAGKAATAPGTYRDWNGRRKIGGNNPPASGKARTLVIRARVTKLDPGSRAARYWAAFGAGAVKIAMTGEIIDAASNKTLVRFKQERRSAVGMFGGGYQELFTRTAHQIGGDIATLINAF